MARTTSNIDLVPREVLEQLKQLDTQLGQTTENLKGLLTEANEVSNALARSTVEYKDLKELLKALDAIGNKVNDTGKKRRDIIMQIADKQEKLKEADSKEAVELQEVNEQLRRQNNLNKSVAKSNIANANSIDAMRERLKRWTAIANRMGTDTPQFQKMSEAVAKLQSELYKYESAMGNYRRNVGNYSSAFNGLQFNIQQVARELPSLTISASQFFLAISNNLPMLVDELNRARAANAALRKEGQATVPVWKQVLKGIVSWQTALVVAITLLTAFSDKIGEWILGLFGGEKAITSFREAQEKLYESMKDGETGIGEQLATLRKLQNAWNDLGNSLQDKKQFIKDNKNEFDELGVSIDTVDDAENLLVRNTEVFVKSLKMRAEATAAFNLASEQYEESIRLMREAELASMKGTSIGDWIKATFATGGGSNPNMDADVLAGKYREERINGLKEEADAAKQTAETYLDLYGELMSDVNKLLENARIKQKEDDGLDDSLGKERDVRLQYYELVYKDYAEKNKAMVMDDKLSYEDRMGALKKFVDAQITAINMAKQAQLDALPEDEDTTFQRLIIERKAQSEIEKIRRESAKIQIDIEKDKVQKEVALKTKKYNSDKMDMSKKEAQEMEDLSKLYTQGLITRDEYEKRKLDITRKYAEQGYNIEIEFLKDILKTAGLSEEDREKFTEQLGKSELEYKKWLYGEDVKEYDKAAKAKEEIDKRKKEIVEDLLMSSFSLAQSLIERDLENQLNKLDEESEANQKWAEEEAERIDRLEESGAISKEQADARKAAIDDQAEAREAQIEERRREVQRRQSVYQKAMSLAQVAINTAESISKTVALMGMPAALPFVAMAAASGAAQAAAIAATPIPQYAEGTEDHPGGLAIVGDGGKSEMIISGGKVYKTPAVDTLVDLPKHAMVLPDFNAGVEKLPEMPRFETTSTVNVDLSKLEESSIENGKLLRLVLKRMEINAKNEIYARELSRLRPTKL